LDSGHIGDKVSLSFFAIANRDRVAGKSGVEATCAFVPSIGGRLVDGTKIQLNFPLGFFSLSSVPLYYHSSTLIRSRVSLINGRIEIQMLGAGAILGNQSFCITLRGMIMGAITSGNVTGISVSTSQVSSNSEPQTRHCRALTFSRTFQRTSTKFQAGILEIG
jgi:hypothetical protein